MNPPEDTKRVVLRKRVNKYNPEEDFINLSNENMNSEELYSLQYIYIYIYIYIYNFWLLSRLFWVL